MEHKPPSRYLLKRVQIIHSRPYIVPESRSSLPLYPFEQQPEDQLRCVELGVVFSSNTPKNTRCHDLLDTYDDEFLDSDLFHFPRSYRSLASSMNPLDLPPCPEDSGYSYKRSTGTPPLVPAILDRERAITHVVVSPHDDSEQDCSHPLISPGEDGLPEDMQDILRQLDDLASWVKAASSSKDCTSSTGSIAHTSPLPGRPRRVADEHSTGHASHGLLQTKGKSRLSSISPLAIRRNVVGSSRDTMPDNPTKMSLGTNCQPEGFIYAPNRNTPEFLVGSSSSPIVYPVYGYSSHPPRYSPLPPDRTHDIPHHRRFLERRSAPCPSPISPLVSPPSGKASFKTLFQRSRCNTTAVSRPVIPSSHTPVESALRQGKRMRLPWLRI